MELWLIWAEDEDDGTDSLVTAFQDADEAQELADMMQNLGFEHVRVTRVEVTAVEPFHKQGFLGRIRGKLRPQSFVSSLSPAQIHRMDQLRMELRGQKLAGRVIGTPISHE